MNRLSRFPPLVAAMLSGIAAISPVLAQPVASNSCSQTVEIHAFLSRGQFQCRFKYYSNAMIEAARQCGRLISDADIREHLELGMRMFDANESKMGHSALCRSLLENFPDVVRD